jgi:hypothetical protein
MKVAVTICDKTYFSLALALRESYLRWNPDDHFLIALMHPFFHLSVGVDIVNLWEAGIEDWSGRSERYSKLELAMALKPDVVQLALDRFPSARGVVYLDSDILAYSSFLAVEKGWVDNEILLTPHSFSPYPFDGFLPNEQTLHNAGVYNAGFLALRRGAKTSAFLKWWRAVLSDKCRIDFANGLFLDQIWLNALPYYFDSAVVKHRGYNVAHFNWHERKITRSGGSHLVNGTEPLVFHHFTGFQLDETDSLSIHQNRYTSSQLPEVANLAAGYRANVRQQSARWIKT